MSDQDLKLRIQTEADLKDLTAGIRQLADAKNQAAALGKAVTELDKALAKMAEDIRKASEVSNEAIAKQAKGLAMYAEQIANLPAPKITISAPGSADGKGGYVPSGPLSSASGGLAGGIPAELIPGYRPPAAAPAGPTGRADNIWTKEQLAGYEEAAAIIAKKAEAEAKAGGITEETAQRQADIKATVESQNAATIRQIDYLTQLSAAMEKAGQDTSALQETIAQLQDKLENSRYDTLKERSETLKENVLTYQGLAEAEQEHLERLKDLALAEEKLKTIEELRATEEQINEMRRAKGDPEKDLTDTIRQQLEAARAAEAAAQAAMESAKAVEQQREEVGRMSGEYVRARNELQAFQDAANKEPDGPSFIDRIKESVGEMQAVWAEGGGGMKGLFSVLTSEQFSTAAKGVGVLAAAFATLKKATSEYMETEQAATKLDVALKKRGQYTAEYRAELQALAQEMEKTTAIANDKWLGVMSNLFKFDAKPEDMGKLLEGVKNLSGMMGTDIEAAAMMLSRAMQGMTYGLSRYGIEIDKSMTKTEQFNDILRQLAEKGGGQMEAQANTIEGSWKKVTLAFSSIFEAMGSVIHRSGLLTVSMQGLAKALNWIADLMPSTTRAIVDGFNEIPKAGEKIRTVSDYIVEAGGNWEKYADALGESADEYIRLKMAQDAFLVGLKEIQRHQDSMRSLETQGRLLDIENDPNMTVAQKARARAMALNEEAMQKAANARQVAQVEATAKAGELAAFDTGLLGQKEEVARKFARAQKLVTGGVGTAAPKEEQLAQIQAAIQALVGGNTPLQLRPEDLDLVGGGAEEAFKKYSTRSLGYAPPSEEVLTQWKTLIEQAKRVGEGGGMETAQQRMDRLRREQITAAGKAGLTPQGAIDMSRGGMFFGGEEQASAAAKVANLQAEMDLLSKHAAEYNDGIKAQQEHNKNVAKLFTEYQQLKRELEGAQNRLAEANKAFENAQKQIQKTSTQAEREAFDAEAKRIAEQRKPSDAAREDLRGRATETQKAQLRLQDYYKKQEEILKALREKPMTSVDEREGLVGQLEALPGQMRMEEQKLAEDFAKRAAEAARSGQPMPEAPISAFTMKPIADDPEVQYNRRGVARQLQLNDLRTRIQAAQASGRPLDAMGFQGQLQALQNEIKQDQLKDRLPQEEAVTLLKQISESLLRLQPGAQPMPGGPITPGIRVPGGPRAVPGQSWTDLPLPGQTAVPGAAGGPIGAVEDITGRAVAEASRTVGNIQRNGQAILSTLGQSNATTEELIAAMTDIAAEQGALRQSVAQLRSQIAAQRANV